MKHKLKEGRVVEIVSLSAKIPTKWIKKKGKHHDIIWMILKN